MEMFAMLDVKYKERVLQYLKDKHQKYSTQQLNP